LGVNTSAPLYLGLQASGEQFPEEAFLHFGLNKYESRDDASYVTVKNKIVEMAKSKISKRPTYGSYDLEVPLLPKVPLLN
jgi:hypothetical protein